MHYTDFILTCRHFALDICHVFVEWQEVWAQKEFILGDERGQVLKILVPKPNMGSG